MSHLPQNRRRIEAKVLCVDDNPINLIILKDVLGLSGATVVCARSGPEALELLCTQDFDVGFFDINMPGMSGVELVQAMRALGGPNASAPVYAVTADAELSGAYLRQCGFAGVALKPVSANFLTSLLEMAVKPGPADRPARRFGEGRLSAGGAPP